MNWDKLDQHNPNLAADLDRLIIRDEPRRCFRYKRQRNRVEGLVKNPRRCVNYDGQRMHVAVPRLIQLRAHGRIEAGHYVGHPQPKEHGPCGNPDHLRCYVPSAHRVKPQAELKRTPNHLRRRKPA